MAFGDDDLDVFFQDGDEVTIRPSGKTFQANFNTPEKIETFGTLNVKTPEVASRLQIEFSTAAAKEAGLARNSEITVKGVRYVVRQIQAQADGKVSIAELRTQ